LGTALEKPVEAAADGWTAPPQTRFERLLREAGIPTGLLCTPEAVRLVYAPAGETSGHITFRIVDMAQVMGRPILAAFSLLLGEYRIFRAEPRERLTSLLAASREAQNLVSTRLARQVLGTLHELLRGFVATDARRTDGASPVAQLAEHDPQRLYAGLVTVLMRLVFVLYAEERDLMPADAIYEENYGLRGLFKKLRDDAARHGDDLMDRRYGAWARLLALFRLIHAGGRCDGFRFTARKGRLFDPDRFPFLEGRVTAAEPPGSLPLLSDGTIWRVLERLLVLDGERLLRGARDRPDAGEQRIATQMRSLPAVSLRLSTRRDLPTPASPWIRTTWPWPRRLPSQARKSSPISAWRPTRGAALPVRIAANRLSTSRADKTRQTGTGSARFDGRPETQPCAARWSARHRTWRRGTSRGRCQRHRQ
jgi:hypothetical protein